jgi:hypothetical protein
MRCDELANDLRSRIRAALVLTQPLEYCARALKARRIEKLVQHSIIDAHAEAACDARRAWVR